MIKKKVAKAQLAQDEVERQRVATMNEDDRMKHQLEKSKAMYSLDYSEHKDVTSVENDEKLKEGKATLNFAEPLRLIASEIVKNCTNFTGEKASFKPSFDNFTKKFPGNPMSGKSTGVQAPVKAAHGVLELSAAWGFLLTPDIAVVPPSDLKSVSLRNHLESVFFFGFTDAVNGKAVEPEYAGSIRIILEGTGKLVMVSLASITEFLNADGPAAKRQKGANTSSSPSLQNVVDFMNLNQDKLDKLKLHGVKVHQCAFEAGNVIWTPPGFLLCITSTNSSCVSGVRKGYLPKKGVSKATLDVCGTFISDDKDAHESLGEMGRLMGIA
jgi:hypothetical protein